MATKSRKYKLDICNLISYGMGTSGNSTTYNILDGFTYTNNGQTCTYNDITADDLALLNTVDYEKRVCNFLGSINIEDPTIIDDLISESETINPDGIICKLNEEFLVYKFLSGVRVIDAGNAEGILEYKAYPSGDDPNNYDWQTNPTFLGLNNNEVYVFEVRDNLNGDIRCSVKRTISLPLLVASTTEPLEEKIISLLTKTDSEYTNGRFLSGCININPALTIGQSISLNYTLSVGSENLANSTAEIFCKPKGSTTSVSIGSVDFNDTEFTDTINVNCGDLICYNLNTEATRLGSSGTSSININAVNGLGSVDPIIDISKCFTTISASQDPFSTIVNLTGETLEIRSNYCSRCGSIYFDPELPDNYSTEVKVRTCVDVLNNGSGYVRVRCKPSNDTIFSDLIYNTQSNTQPQIIDINVNNGDCIIFNTNSTYNTSTPNSNSESIIEIIGVSGDTGILPSISTQNNIDSVSVNNQPEPIVVNVCQQNATSLGTYDCSINGVINLVPALTTFQTVTIDVDSIASISDSSAFSRTAIYCKPYSSTGFVPIIEYANENSGIINTDQIVMRFGDQICYTLQSDSFSDWVTGTSCIKLTNITGSNTLIPTINPNKNSDIALSSRTGTPTSISVSLDGQSSTNLFSKICSGSVVFTPVIPSIPSYNYIDVSLTTRVSSCLGASACAVLRCNNIKVFENTNQSPRVKTVRVTPNDTLDYCLVATCDNNTLFSCGCSSITITSVSGPSSVSPTINNSNKTSVACVEKVPKTITVGLNNIENTTNTSRGLFVLSTPLGATENITVNYNSTVNEEIAATSRVFLYCKPYGDSSYTPFMELYSNTGTVCNGTFTLNFGDSVCYEINAEQFGVPGSSAEGTLDITSLSGSLSINPVIDSNNCSDIVSVSA